MKNVFVLFSSSLLTLLSVSQQKKNKEVKKFLLHLPLPVVFCSSRCHSSFLRAILLQSSSSFFNFLTLPLSFTLAVVVVDHHCSLCSLFPFIFLPLSLFPIQMPKLKVQLLFSSLLLVNVPRRRRRLQLFIKKET